MGCSRCTVRTYEEQARDRALELERMAATPAAPRNPLLRPALRMARPAGQAASTETTPPASTPTEPASTTGDFDERGRLIGVDGVLDQIGEALRRQVEPIVRDTVLPVLQRDVALQREVGAAAGVQLGREIRPWVILGALALATVAVVQISKARRRRRR